MNTLLTSPPPPHKPEVPLPEPTIEQALRRIKATHLPARRGKLNVLAWFVEVAQPDFDPKSPAEILAKQEEFAALERHLADRRSPPLPSPWDLKHLSQEAYLHLTELADTGFTKLGPFTMWVYIGIPAKLSLTVPKGHSGPVSRDSPVVGVFGLLREMAVLLKEYATSVVRCPRCKKIFVKPRTNARYCSRSCQNSFYMDIKRNPPEGQRPKGKAHTPKKKVKGGSHHGKAKR